MTQTGCIEGDIWLVDGPSPMEGRAEICENGEWGTICNAYWDDREARVVCRQLGYESETAMALPSYHVHGTGPIHKAHLTCEGNETNLIECTSVTSYPTHFCRHSDDAGVICYPNGTY